MLSVYFIQAGTDGPIKIGMAGNVRKRLAALQTAHYEELQLLASMPAFESLEPFLHERFAASRIRGEWFRPEARGLAELIESARRGTAPDWVLPHVRLFTLAAGYDGCAAWVRARRHRV